MLQRRHLMVTFLAFGLFTLYCIRNSLSISIVAMVKTTELTDNYTFECTYDDSDLFTATVDNIDQGGTFDWDPYIQGLVLGSFFYGYIAGNFVGGVLSEFFEAKRILSVGIFLTSALTLASPPAAYAGYNYFIGLRVLEGVTEGITIPAMIVLCSNWCPSSEMALAFSLVQAGARFGNMVSIPLTAFLCSSIGGWPSSFYVFGAFGVLFAFLFSIFVYDQPSDDPNISDEELKFILQNRTDHKNSKVQIPWKKIAFSQVLWIATLGNFAIAWGNNLFLSETPSFLSYIFHFDLNTNGILNSIACLMTMLAVVLGGYLCKIIINMQWLSITNTRKLMHFIGTFGAALSLLGMNLSGCDRLLVLIFLYLGEIFNTCGHIGVYVSLTDVSPTHSGTLMSVVNGFGFLSGFLAPLMIGSLTEGNQTLGQWHKAFYISMGINIFCGLLYSVFGTSKYHKWDKVDDEVQAEPVNSSVVRVRRNRTETRPNSNEL